MRTVIVRLAEAPADGHLRGVLEVLGIDGPITFADDEQLLALLRTALARRDAARTDDLNPT
ncbi:hypothetical protein [Nitriliruptor alkaliphilus]|uniref:hypothetical protein n=1 Tax=Nitriliruptor alkaliphilus TaxID=427918 RepID=UPI0012EE1548|nr:hypothetical protein [Nitriliruptor alkaliphilus]